MFIDSFMLLPERRMLNSMEILSKDISFPSQWANVLSVTEELFALSEKNNSRVGKS